MNHLKERELTGPARAALLGMWLREGQRLAPIEIADRLGLTRQGAEYLCDTLSGVLPIRKDAKGRWHWVT